MPVSRTAKCSQTSAVRRTAIAVDVDHHLALLGELDGVADQVDDDLPQPARVADQHVGHVGRNVAGQLQPLLLGPQGQRLRSCRRGCRAGRKSIVSSSSLPASILEKSRMSLMTASSDSAETLDHVQVFALLARSASVSRTSSVMPMTPFMGVRISWLMLARNSLLARLAASAASLASRSSSSALLAVGDVARDAEGADDLAAAVAQRHLGGRDPVLVAVGPGLFFLLGRPTAARCVITCCSSRKACWACSRVKKSKSVLPIASAGSVRAKRLARALLMRRNRLLPSLK